MKHRLTIVRDRIHPQRYVPKCECGGFLGHTSFYTEFSALKDGSLHLEAVIDQQQEQIDAMTRIGTKSPEVARLQAALAEVLRSE